MKSYITAEMVTAALRRMQDFHHAQVDIHQRHGLDFRRNVGRRNQIMSLAQEVFLAEEISRVFTGVSADGHVNQPDIIVGQLNREIECKITSPSEPDGAFSLKTDYATLQQKGSLDYVYILADHPFEKFCVLHFLGLTVNDFHQPFDSSRGKSVMAKHVGFDKCVVLHGRVETHISRSLAALGQQLEDVRRTMRQDLSQSRENLSSLTEVLTLGHDPTSGEKLSSKEKTSLKRRIKTAKNRPELIQENFQRKRDKIFKEMSEAIERVPRYTFHLEPITWNHNSSE